MRLRAVSAVASIAKARVREEGSGRGWEERERDASKHTNITHRQRRRQIFSGLRLCDLLSRVYGLRFTVYGLRFSFC